jgi:hypothetical protein
MKKIFRPAIRLCFAAVSLLLCVAFSAGAFGQQIAARTLDDKAVSALLSQLEESLSQLIDDEPMVEQIVDKWESRDDLVGKTRPQILKLVFADVRSVIGDKEALDAIWAAWTGDKTSDPKRNSEDSAFFPTRSLYPWPRDHTNCRGHSVSRRGANMNPGTGTMEFSLRDPDGYYVTISAAS